MRSRIIALILCFAAADASAQSATDPVEPAPQAPVLRKAPVHAAGPTRRCPPAGRRSACSGARNAGATGKAVAVVAPVEEPMLPPLGAHVWQHEDPPMFDPYQSAGPWYKAWTHEGTNVVQWRYGFPGGQVDWFRGLGWRPGFGWY